jgi:hypothetical protein
MSGGAPSNAYQLRNSGQAAASDAVVAETAPLIGVDDLVGGTDCQHPNNSGHDDIASAFAAVIDVASIVGPPATGLSSA